MVETFLSPARIRIPIPPHLVKPVLLGLSALFMVFGFLLVIFLIHTVLTRRKTIFGPNSRVKLTGAELVKDLLSNAFMAAACIAVSIFCFVQTTWVDKVKQPPRETRDPFATSPPDRFIPGMPMPRSQSGEEED